jgi:hypothetical protein
MHASPKDGYKSSSVKSDMQTFHIFWRQSERNERNRFQRATASLALCLSMLVPLISSIRLFLNLMISLPVINLFPSASHF